MLPHAQNTHTRTRKGPYLQHVAVGAALHYRTVGHETQRGHDKSLHARHKERHATNVGRVGDDDFADVWEPRIPVMAASGPKVRSKPHKTIG